MLKLDRQRILDFYSKYMVLIGCAGHLMFIFQGLQILANRSAKDVSLPGFLIALFSLVSWLFYGLLKEDTALIIVNLFGALSAAFCIISQLIMR